jgi:DNA-binding transcriptional LysR family regulator
VQRLFDDVNRLEAELGDYASGVKGQVRIHAHSSAVVQYLPQDISSFLQQFPDIRVDLREETTSAVLQSVADGVADIGVFGGNVEAPPGTRVLDYRRDHLAAVLPKDHPFAGRSSLEFREIQNADHISLETGSSLQTLLATAAQASGGSLSVKIEVTTFDAAWRMVEAGLGVAVIPQLIVEPHAQDGRIAVVPLSDPWALRRLSICLREGRDLASPARRMLEHLTSRGAQDCRMVNEALPNYEWIERPGVG